ncbi:MAG: class I SAM-dependent methyltransferase [Flavobacterium sp.]|nr:class I SAM-dependent methyltransferase [Flavobacterium sp.]MBP6146774.1 class I SAM-dependent methyltransferase [Flavobacterium sp.]MBP7182594.1 class I SAM-dependent methyltransferase [Flavobacterium sp.]MBP7316678.1 class I SAM-dependent methyltransferase [Flavobacterium sp.]MBP8886979.1 class I SAM-dependent methyltransferase [Flavobacterium sp.]HRM46077.1 class I SAM-dependent methyltransferase [Flavobacterium sp.]
MTEFWEKTFKAKQEMWGFQPALSTVLTKELFMKREVKNVLIPGIGYGRNAAIFIDIGMTVTGIEISQTAIDLAKKHFGNDLVIYHGSVTEMPFDKNQYDGIYCYALIHLLDKKERAKLIQDCFNQLSENGLMVFTVVTKKAQIYGQGNYIEKDRYEIFDGLKMFFYDKVTIQEEFEKAGLFEIIDVDDVHPFYLLKCKKATTLKLTE